MASEAPDWEAFGREIMKWWPDGGVDGFELQDIAEKHRVILPTPGGFDPAIHEDTEGVGLEPGDPWFDLNYPAVVARTPAPGCQQADLTTAAGDEMRVCGDCPPAGYPADDTRCAPCPRRTAEMQRDSADGTRQGSAIGGLTTSSEGRRAPASPRPAVDSLLRRSNEHYQTWLNNRGEDGTAPASPRQGHSWVDSTLNHGNWQCKLCGITDMEARAIGSAFCEQAELDAAASPRVPTEDGRMSKRERQAAWAALRMVHEAIGEMFGPQASIENEDALLRGPEYHHEAAAIVDALIRLQEAHAAALRERWEAGRDAVAAWHDRRARETPDAFEQEFHEVSRDTVRTLAYPETTP